MSVIDKTYHHLLQTILDDGFMYEDPNRKGINRIQIPSYTFKHDFKDGFPAITTKKLYWKGVVGELLWFLRGDTNIKYLVDNGINIWNKDAYNYYKNQYSGNIVNTDFTPFTLDNFVDAVKDGRGTIKGDLGRIYGAQWRKWSIPFEERDAGYMQGLEAGEGLPVYDEDFPSKKLDQISNLIKGLKENPMGTKHIVTAWNPAELDNMALPPCHWSFEILVEPLNDNERFKIQPYYETLENRGDFSTPKYQFTLKWHQRSCDSYLGIPFNIASYALLAQIIGKMTNMIPKSIIGDLSNVHIYEPHLDAVKEQLSRSTNMHNSECELLIGDSAIEVIDEYEKENILFNDIFENFDINDFTLSNHTEQSAIPAEMLPYSS
jgi:thymidylate synthase